MSAWLVEENELEEMKGTGEDGVGVGLGLSKCHTAPKQVLYDFICII